MALMCHLLSHFTLCHNKGQPSLTVTAYFSHSLLHIYIFYNTFILSAQFFMNSFIWNFCFSKSVLVFSSCGLLYLHCLCPISKQTWLLPALYIGLSTGDERCCWFLPCESRDPHFTSSSYRGNAWGQNFPCHIFVTCNRPKHQWVNFYHFHKRSWWKRQECKHKGNFVKAKAQVKSSSFQHFF